jgi:outer membrane biosynthesis protein TonB
MVRRETFTAFGWILFTLASFAQSSSSQATHTLKPTAKTVAWGYYDAKAPPVLRVKSGDTVEIQTPTASVATQDEKRRIIYVRHLEPPLRYPPLARATRLTGTIVIKLEIAADGAVESTESAPGDKNTSGFDILRGDAETIVKRWTFGCVGCPANVSFEHAIRFNYKLDDELASPDRVVMNLPDDVTVSTAPVTINSDRASSKKGSQ